VDALNLLAVAKDAEHAGNAENITKNEKLIIAVKAIKDTELVIVIKEEEPVIDEEEEGANSKASPAVNVVQREVVISSTLEVEKFE